MTQIERSKRILRERGIFLLPNLLTTVSLFAGFYSIVSVLKAHFSIAAIAIFVSMIADCLDGRVARLTNTQTAFGVQYDSLADMVTFGVATPFLVYIWALTGLGKIGWLAAFLFVAATALRLARFNTQAASADKRYFQGLPCPSAAAVLVSLVWCAHEYAIAGKSIALLVLLLTLALAFAMVSTLRYHSFKKIDIKGRISFVTVLMTVVIIAGVALNPPLILFLIFLAYAASGPVLTITHLRRKRLAHRGGK